MVWRKKVPAEGVMYEVVGSGRGVGRVCRVMGRAGSGRIAPPRPAHAHERTMAPPGRAPQRKNNGVVKRRIKMQCGASVWVCVGWWTAAVIRIAGVVG